MEKIVVVTNETGNANTLTKLLKVLLPEFEICTVSLHSDGFERCPNDSLPGRSKVGTRGGSHGKHFDRR